jgi:hypothetical protein
MRHITYRPVKLWGMLLVMSLLSLGIIAGVRSPGNKGAGSPDTPLPVVLKPATQPGAVTIPDTLRPDSASALGVPAGKTTGSALPQTGEQIKWHVISGGGNRSTSTSYVMSATVGQTAVGRISSTSYKMNQGFWQNFSDSGGCCVGLTGNVDCDPSDGCDISDLTALIDNLYITFTPLCCTEEANIDGQPGIDISDLSALIDYLYISFTPPAACL